MRFSVKLKLGLGFGVVIVLSAATAMVGISNLTSLNGSLDHIVRGSVQRVQLSE